MKERNCFSRDLRLLRSLEFSAVFNAPERRSSDHYFTVLGRSCEGETLAHSRLGLVIAKKKVRRAHERNRIKRLARECFRKQARKIEYRDVVVLAKLNADKADNQVLIESLNKHFRRMRK